MSRLKPTYFSGRRKLLEIRLKISVKNWVKNYSLFPFSYGRPVAIEKHFAASSACEDRFSMQ